MQERGRDHPPTAAGCREDGPLKDGHTRKLDRSEVASSLFLARHRVTLVVVEGAAIGAEWSLEEPSYTIGRGPGVDIAVADAAMSKVHASVELVREGVRIRDMGSTNGLAVNGHTVAAADLKHGDRIAIGEHALQLVVEPRDRVGRYDLSEES